MYFKILNILIIFIAIFLTIEGFPIRRIKVNNDVKIKSEIREIPNEGDDESRNLFELLEIFDEPISKPGHYREKSGWEKLIPHKPILAEVMVLSVLIVAGFVAVGMLAVGIAWIIATNKWLEVQEDIFDGTKVLRFPGAEDKLRGMHFPSERFKNTIKKKRNVEDDVDVKKIREKLEAMKLEISESKRHKRDIERQKKMQEIITKLEQQVEVVVEKENNPSYWVGFKERLKIVIEILV